MRGGNRELSRRKGKTKREEIEEAGEKGEGTWGREAGVKEERRVNRRLPNRPSLKGIKIPVFGFNLELI